MKSKKPSKIDSRIWELDALRGFMILCVIAVHTLFDLEGIVNINYPAFYIFIRENGGILFILLSGICATLGTKTFKRGLIVFGAGMLITAVTYGLSCFGMFSEQMIISFGILHMLGFCMIIWPLVRKLPMWSICIIGILIVILGFAIEGKTSEIPFSYIVGIPSYYYAAGDYFPLVPYTGWFFIGAFAGSLLYRKKQSLFPKAPKDFFLIRFLRYCGVYSLYIYLIHQPIAFGIISLISYFI